MATYCAVLLAAASHRDRAAPFVAIAEKSQLLPEERRLIEAARAAR